MTKAGRKALADKGDTIPDDNKENKLIKKLPTPPDGGLCEFNYVIIYTYIIN